MKSHVGYAECLDIPDSLICRYRNSYNILLCEDFNGTLFSARPYNKHDQILQKKFQEQELTFRSTKEHTFYHHSGSSSSQIDYISRLGMSVTTQGGSGRQYVTGTGRTTSK